MKILLLAMLLTVSQTVPPVPRQAADKTTSNTQQAEGKTKAKQDVTINPVPIGETVPGHTSAENSKNEGRKDTEKAITVSELPPVSIHRDWVDCISVFLTLALAIVGACGIRYAIKTLKTLKLQAKIMSRQTTATRVSSEATLLYVKAFIEGQRAQLAISFDSIPPGIAPKIRAKLTNTGLIPAYNCICEIWVEVLPYPFEDFTAATTHYKLENAMTVYANAPTESVAEVWLKRDLQPAEISVLHSGQSNLCFRLNVKYRDAFHKCLWQDFGFFVVKGGMSFLPKYNDSGEC